MPSLLQQLADQLTTPFVVIGGHALQAYGHLRTTLDTDILIASGDLDHLTRELESLGFRNAASNQLVSRFSRSTDDDSYAEMLDLLLVDQATFDEILAASGVSGAGSNSWHVPCLAHLVALKLHAIRQDPRRELQDLADIQALLRLNPEAINADELQQLIERHGPVQSASRILIQLTLER